MPGGMLSIRVVRVFTVFATCVALLAVAPTALGASRIYWSDFFSSQVQQADLSGTNAMVLKTLPNGSNPDGEVIDSAGGRIYWADAGLNKIESANLDGSDTQPLNVGMATVSFPVGLAIDGGRIYWVNSTAGVGGISWANLNGSGGADLNIGGANPNDPAGLAIDDADGRIYWTNRTTSTISYANLDGSGDGGDLSFPVNISHQPEGLAVDAASGRIYWANYGLSTISFANLNGTGAATLVTAAGTVNHPAGIAIDHAANRVYWANFQGSSIGFANLDNTGGGGTLPIAAANTSGYPVFPILQEPPVPAGAPTVTGKPVVGSTLDCSQGQWAPDQTGAFLFRAPQSFSYAWTISGQPASSTSAAITASTSGSYTCTVTVANAAGHASQASSATVVKASLPNTVIKRVRVSSKRHRATFRFAATGTATRFECMLIASNAASKFRRCTSPVTFKHLRPDVWTFEVRAVGPGGTDPTPATRRFTIKRRHS